MGKFDVKELRGGFRDPRADETGGGAYAGVSHRPPASPADLMQQLGHGSLPLDLTPPGHVPVSDDGFVPNSLTGDPFGILGTTVSDLFAIEKVIAHGGFGVIYRANHLRFAAPVAIKCLKIPNNLSQDERDQFLSRFRKEGEVMFRLSSSIPEVVRPLHIDAIKTRDGKLVPYIAMEWLVGETLKDVIVKRLSEGKRPLSIQNSVNLLSPVARALARSHHFPSEEGPLCILHCDLKPDNIFVATVDGGQILKVFDFGIAKVRSAATRQAGGFTAETQSNMFTPAYAAPEQWTPDRYGQTGPWTDVFALALTLTEVVTQKPAIDGPPTAMLSQSVDERRRPTPGRLGVTLPDRLEAIFVKALAVDPKARFQSITAFWGALEEALSLAPSVGSAARGSLAGVAALLPSTWEDEAPMAATAPVAATPAPTFGGELDLDVRPPQAPAPAGSAPQGMAPPAPQALPPMSASGLDLDSAPISSHPAPQGYSAAPPGAAPPVVSAPQGFAPPVVSAPQGFAPPAGSAPQGFASPTGDASAPMDFGGSIELGDARPERPARPAPSGPGMSSGGLTPQGFGLPPMGPPSAPGAQAQEGVVVGPAAKERLQAAASKAGHVASQVATVAATSAAAAAKNIATRALAVDALPKIQIDQPSTWVRPMRGPLIAMGAAILISVLAVVFSKMTASHFKVSWVSLPLLIAAIAFAGYRWVKLTSQ